VEFLCGQLDLCFGHSRVQQPDPHDYCKPWGKHLLHFFRYPDRLRLAVLRGTDVMAEIGSRAWLFGALVSTLTDANGQAVTYPTADYKIDGVLGESPPATPLDKALT
jgi:hypothetical protein